MTPQEKNDLFKRFWAVYPRHVSKAASRRAFNRIVTSEKKFTEIMDGLNYLIENDYQFREPRFIPHPSTFLNGERWEDEPTEGSAMPDFIRKQARGDYDNPETVTREELDEMRRRMRKKA